MLIYLYKFSSCFKLFFKINTLFLPSLNKMENKIKIRSSKDLNYRKKGFLEICNILEDNKIQYFIWGGTLLGFKRDKNFIKWDWDVEIGLFEKNIIKSWDIILKSLKKQKFRIIYENKEELKIEVIKYRPEKITKFTISAWKFDFFTQNYIRYKLNIPRKFFDNMTRIKFSNRWFLCPGPVDEFLKLYYGNWKKPLRSTNKKGYLSEIFFKNNLWRFYIYLNKIKNKISI